MNKRWWELFLFKSRQELIEIIDEQQREIDQLRKAFGISEQDIQRYIDNLQLDKE